MKQKRFNISLIFISLVFLLSGCVQQNETVKSTETNNATNTGVYNFKIQITLNNSPSNERVPIYTFSRPIFEETSEFTKTINQIYLNAENELIHEMNKEDYELPDDVYWSADNPWHYTEQSECTYEKSNIISFVTNGDWYMGGVHNSWKEGHTFDFVLKRELKLSDILYGDESQIRNTLENKFYEWYKQTHGYEMEDEADKKSVKEQSGPNANFYLTDEGVYVFYHPYTIPATPNGVDILISWKQTKLV